MKIKIDQTRLRNPLHFATQLNERAHVFKPKKGRGSYKRNKRVEW